MTPEYDKTNLPLSRTELGIGKPRPGHPSAEREAREALVQVARSPLCEPRINTLIERVDALCNRPV